MKCSVSSGVDVLLIHQKQAQSRTPRVDLPRMYLHCGDNGFENLSEGGNKYFASKRFESSFRGVFNEYMLGMSTATPCES